MEITEIRIKLMNDPSDRLLAFCSVTFDHWFVIRDLKIIQGTKGSFVAMPSRKLTDRCPQCCGKNHLRARFCNDCGVRLYEDRALRNDDGRAKLYADIAHPITSDCRDSIQRQVLDAYTVEVDRSKLPDYICTYDDYGEDSFAMLPDDVEGVLPLPRIVAVPMNDNFRRRESVSLIPAPHHAEISMHRESSGRVAVVSRGDGDEEGFGAGII